MRVRTVGGSIYVVGPSPAGDRVRIARVSDHVVRGTVGPLSFVEDFDKVELVNEGGFLCLRCTAVDGTRFQTSRVVAILDDPARTTIP